MALISDDTTVHDDVDVIDAERDERLRELYDDLHAAEEAAAERCDSCVSAIMQAGALGPVRVHERGCPRDARVRALHRLIEAIEDR